MIHLEDGPRFPEDDQFFILDLVRRFLAPDQRPAPRAPTRREGAWLGDRALAAFLTEAERFLAWKAPAVSKR